MSKLCFLSFSFGDDIPGMEGLGTGEFTVKFKILISFIKNVSKWLHVSNPPTDITVICPWEAFNHLELHELAQYGII